MKGICRICGENKPLLKGGHCATCLRAFPVHKGETELKSVTTPVIQAGSEKALADLVEHLEGQVTKLDTIVEKAEEKEDGDKGSINHGQYYDSKSNDESEEGETPDISTGHSVLIGIVIGVIAAIMIIYLVIAGKIKAPIIYPR